MVTMQTEMKLKSRKPRKKLSPAMLIEWRNQMGYTMIDAAEALGCSKRSLVNWENGHNDIPRYIGLAMTALHTGSHPWGSRAK